MCGITGFAERNHKAETARRIVKGMADLITYRGPDGEGYYVDDQVALGHRRLSIIDLEGGKQPMFNEDGSLVCIFNGEIYNFQTLREELIAAGHTFATRSDTEVLLHGYEQWGNQLPGKLRGMFTFVIWDQKTKTMFGARDIFGIKPFYYYNQDGLFLFGSEIKSFLAHPGFKKELNEERLPEYLSIEYIPNEETMFKNVYKLPSGCMFTWENGELTVERYYEIKYHVDDSKSLEEWEKIITDTFAESVAAHQIADVEVGCFLSSGKCIINQLGISILILISSDITSINGCILLVPCLISLGNGIIINQFTFRFFWNRIVILWFFQLHFFFLRIFFCFFRWSCLFFLRLCIF